ncbi:MAG: hypothetical protein HC871_04615 [Rhizobiales bacterium]|nr:hypothetical protein [Hyphomicrobiales bacterium]
MSDLEGLLVVTVEHAVAAPYASGRLADAGARVIKVERPEGDFARGYDAHVKGGSAYFVWLNRGKESVCLDLKAEGDRQILAAMIAKADVLIQNLGPGVMERLGFDPADLRERYPGLIICSISGYGSEGPWKDQKAYDLLIQAESGLCAINGTAEGPARVGVSVCDIAAGMTAFQAIAATKDTNLAVVAPGIAEALFATALGLLAAIPAVVGYNRYTASVNSFAVRLQGFADEFSAILSRQLDERAR